MSLARIHQKLGTAGFVISIVALVAALGGGAYAAKGGLTGKEKKEVKAIAKHYAGKRGPRGKNGQNGQNGANGAQGEKGATGATGSTGGTGLTGEAGEKGEKGDTGVRGATGAAGESPVVIPLAASNGSGHCEEGGAKIVGVVDPANEEAYACNGSEGSGTGGGYPETLPSGRSESGFWEVQGENGYIFAGSIAVSTISFPLPLETAPSETVLVAETPTSAEEAKCPGNAAEPKATEGVLCLYSFGSPYPTLETGVPFQFGAALYFEQTAEGFGSWAVTAE